MLIWVLVILPLWIVVAARIPIALSQPRSRPLYLAFLSLAVSLTVIRPEPMHAIVRWTGLQSMADLIKHIAGMISVYCILSWVVSVTPQIQQNEQIRLYYRIARGRSRHIVTATAVTLSLATFPLVADDDRNSSASPDLAVAQIGHPLGAIPLQIFEAYLAFGMACCALMCWDAWRRDRRSSLGYGMLLVSVGCTAGLCYAVLRFSWLMLAFVGIRLPLWVLSLGTSGFVIISVLAIVLGTSVPMYERAVRVLAYRSSLLKLRTLWEEITRAVPEVIPGAHGPSRIHDRLNVLDLYVRRHRRIVEIQDGALSLQRWASPDLGEAVRQAATGNDRIFAEALLIKVAAARKIQGRPPSEGRTDALLPSIGHAEVKREYLQQLSWALRPHPEVPIEQQFASLLPTLDQRFLNDIRTSLGTWGCQQDLA